MGIEERTIGELFDLLITTSNRAWHCQDKIMDESLSFEERFKASLETHKSNNRRNQLIRAIDKRLGDSEFTQPEKTYNEQFKR